MGIMSVCTCQSMSVVSRAASGACVNTGWHIRVGDRGGLFSLIHRSTQDAQNWIILVGARIHKLPNSVNQKVLAILLIVMDRCHISSNCVFHILRQHKIKEAI